MSVFKELLEYKINNPHDRLVKLLKFLDRKAHDTINHCIQQSTAVGYQIIAKFLLEQHGDPHCRLCAYRKEIKSWLILKPGDSVAYRKFYTFLIKFASIMSCQQQNSFDTSDFLVTMMSKLKATR